jgi:hypothetical protein
MRRMIGYWANKMETRKVKKIVPELLKWFAANARDLP